MLAQKQEINLQLNQLLDAVVLGLLFWGCYFLRLHRLVVLDGLVDISTFEHFYWILAVIVPISPLLLELQGFYNYPLEKTVTKSLQQIAHAGVWLGLILGALVIFLRLAVPSRSVLILFSLLAPLILIGRERLLIWHRIKRLREGAARERIIVAGERDKAAEIIASFTPTQRLEIEVVETIDLEKPAIEALVEAIHRHNVGRVVLAFRRIELEKVQKAIEVCELEGVEAWLSADFIQTSVARPTYENLGRRPMLVFRATPDLSWTMLVKNVVDRVGGISALILFSPVLLFGVIAVKLSSPGPIVFRQRRAGLHGKPFTMLKFRTMKMDAEERRVDVMHLNEMSGPVFKIKDDPRVTWIGQWLRKLSIDELPQLFNVVRGEMSLVGPRPLPIYEVAKFENHAHRRRLSMKPGLTCLWQVRGRNNVKCFDQWVHMDLEYIDNWSLTLDFIILLRTIPVVLCGWGAK